MSEHKKELEPYKSGNKQVQGKYHFKIPESLELGTYPMEIEYESTDEAKPDAYQYNGFVVIGHRAYLKTSPVIIPFNTNATEEALVPLADKLKTSFNGIVDAFSSSDFTNPINKLPIHIQFVKGQFKDYHAPNVNYTKTLFSDFESSYKSLTLALPENTNATGKATKSIKVSDVYTEDEQINDINTMLFKCKGTLDRGTDNYVPVIVEAPLIIGTTTVWLQNIPNNTREVEIDDDTLTVASTCGKGTLEFDCEFYYRAFMRNDSQNNRMKYGYEDYRTDPDKMVKVGSVVLQYYHNNKWNTVPAEQLSAVDSHTVVNSDGSIKQTAGSETGKIRVEWTNPLSYNTKSNIKYRWAYSGKVGATYGGLSATYYLALDPSYGTPSSIETTTTLNTDTINMKPNETKNLTGTVTSEITPITGDVKLKIPNVGTINGTLNNDGTFTIPVTNIPAGTYVGTAEFSDSTNRFETSTDTVTITCTKYTSEIVFETLTNNTVTAEYNTLWSVVGKIVVKDGNTVISNIEPTGSITGANTLFKSAITNSQFRLSNHDNNQNPNYLNARTYTVHLTYSGNNYIESCTLPVQIVISPVEVEFTLPSQTLSRWDENSDNDSDTFTISLSDKNNKPVEDGTLKVCLIPSNSTFSSVGKFEVASKTVTKTANTWNFNTYTNLNMTALFNAMKAQDYLIFTNYRIIAEYTSSSGNYTAESETAAPLLRYRCKYPALYLVTNSSFIDSSRTHIQVPNGSYDLSIDDFSSGMTTDTYYLKDNVTMELGITDSYGDLIGGVGHFFWFIHETKTITLYKMNDDGTYQHDEHGNRIENTDDFYKNSNVPLSPCYPNYPISLGYMRRVPDKASTSYTTEHTYNWRTTGEQLENEDNFYMYFVFDKYLNNIIESTHHTLRQPYDSLMGGVDSNHQPITPVNEEYSYVIKLKLKMFK